MSSKPSKVEQSGRPLLKKVITAILGGLLLVAAIPFFIVWYGEKERKELMRDYEVPQIFLARIIALERTPAKTLMESGETLICAVGSYSGVERKKELNEKQKLSTPKDKLPSEDGVWYLIFFSETRSMRIYLIENRAIAGITNDSDGCIGESGYFEVIRKEPRGTDSPDGYHAFVIRMKRGI
ncbi:MAG: hypothetical protein IDH49_12270 [Gammaproteobacteria bacterium]|nr:hypothetical protein [Gammaproteobacteria bacterium]